MKYIKKILIILFCSLFICCSKDNPTESGTGKYDGTWLWKKTVGGLFPRVIEPKDGITIKIGFSNRKFFMSRNDSVKTTANFKIEKTENGRDKILFYNITNRDYYFSDSSYSGDVEYPEINSDTLIIWDGMVDGFSSIYKKIPK